MMEKFKYMQEREMYHKLLNTHHPNFKIYQHTAHPASFIHQAFFSPSQFTHNMVWITLKQMNLSYHFTVKYFCMYF